MQPALLLLQKEWLSEDEGSATTHAVAQQHPASATGAVVCVCLSMYISYLGVCMCVHVVLGSLTHTRALSRPPTLTVIML